MSITNDSNKNKLRASLFKPATKDSDPIRYQEEENQWGHILNIRTLGVGTDAGNLGIDGRTSLIADMFDTVEGYVLSEVSRLDTKILDDITTLDNKLLGGATTGYNTLGKLEGHIKSNDSDITDLYNVKVNKSSISDSTTNVSHTLVSSAYATKTTMDRANSAYALADTKVRRAGDTWTGVHDLTGAELSWSRDSDYAKIYMKDEGGNAERLAISFGDDEGTDGLILEWQGTERLVTFHQNKTLFEKDIYEKGTKLETKYARANGTTTRDFSMSDAYIYGGDITFKDGATTLGRISNLDGTTIYDTGVAGKAHSFTTEGHEKIRVESMETQVMNRLVVEDGAEIREGFEVRRDGAAPYIDLSNDLTGDYDARIILTDDDTLDIQGVALDHFKVRGHRVLTTERMGHGSLINADKIDDIEGSRIVLNDVDNILNGNQTINGAIIVRDEIVMKSQDDKNNTQLGEFIYRHYDNSIDGVNFLSKFELNHKVNAATPGVSSSLVEAHGVSGYYLFEGGQRLSNRYLGLHAKADDSELLDGRDSTQYEQIDKFSKSLSAGWHTIARGHDKCSAKFKINDGQGSNHGHATFYASVTYEKEPTINVLESGAYGNGNGIFSKIRIVSDGDSGSVYENAELQVYIDESGTLNTYIMEDLGNHLGWVLVNHEAIDPALTHVGAEINFNTANGFMTTGTIYSNSNHRVYDTSNPPTKAEVGLSNVPNYGATSSLTDGSTSKFANAKATKDLENKKIDKTSIFNDVGYTNPMTATQVVGGLVGENFLNRIVGAESEIDDLWVLMNAATDNGTFDSLQELLTYMNTNSDGIEHANTKVEATISDTKNALGQYHVLNLGGYTPDQWMRSDVDDTFNANMTLANGKKLYIGDTGRYIAQDGVGMKIYTDDNLVISGMHDTTLDFDSNKITSSEDLYVNGNRVFYQGNIVKSDVGLSNIPNAISDLRTLASSSTLATSKAVKLVNDAAGVNSNRITSNDTDIATINSDMGIGTYTHDSFVKKDEDSLITANLKVTGSILADKIVAGDGGAVSVPYPKGAKFMAVNGSTGAIKIKLPVSWNDTMLNMTLNIHSTVPNRNVAMNVGGFLSTQAGAWVNPFARTQGNDSVGDYNVTFGHDGTNACIIVANTTSTWTNLIANVVGLEAGYISPQDEDITRYTWDDNWSITLLTSLNGVTTSSVVSENLLASDWNKLKNLPAHLTSHVEKVGNSDKLDGLNSTQFMRADVAAEKIGALTMVGSGNAIQYKDNSDVVRDVIKFHDGGQYGSAVSINGGARTVISSGEAAHSNLNNIASAGNETLGLASDQNIMIHTALQSGWAARKSWELTASGDFKAYSGEMYAQDGTKRVYHQGFQGHDSGLIADTVDGKHLSQLIQTDVATQTIDGGINTSLIIRSDSEGMSDLSLYGAGQGTGRVYVGQDTDYGGGIEYNGDSSTVTSGAGSDMTALYRRNAGGNHWTARNSQANNNWEFRGDVKAQTVTVAGWTIDIVEV